MSAFFPLLSIGGGADQEFTASRMPDLTDERAKDLVTQTSALSVSLLSNLDSIRKVYNATGPVLVITGAASVSAAALLSNDVQRIKAGDYSPSSLKELGGDALTLAGDWAMYNGAILSNFKNPAAKRLAVIVDGIGNAATVGGIAINHSDYMAEVFSTDLKAFKGWAAEKANDLRNRYLQPATDHHAPDEGSAHPDLQEQNVPIPPHRDDSPDNIRFAASGRQRMPLNGLLATPADNAAASQPHLNGADATQTMAKPGRKMTLAT